MASDKRAKVRITDGKEPDDCEVLFGRIRALRRELDNLSNDLENYCRREDPDKGQTLPDDKGITL